MGPTYCSIRFTRKWAYSCLYDNLGTNIPTMPSSLEAMYRSHHATVRGSGFVLLGKERGQFLAQHISKGKTVLDIGCRDGALTASYAEGNTVLGIDIDSVALTAARERLGIETKQADLNGDWGVENRTYDAVVAAEVIEHLFYPEVVFKKIAKALRADGQLLGTVPNAFSLAHRFRYLLKRKKGTPLSDPTHINHFTVEDVKLLLAENFEEVEIVGLGRLGWLARRFPQAFAFDLAFQGRIPR